MKKIKLCVLLMCLLVCVSTYSFASNFYDTKGTVYESAVNKIARLGIINGMSEKVFAPNNKITRGELAKIIVYTKGLEDYAQSYELKTEFKDVKGHWAEEYVAIANDLELLKGYEDKTFRPDNEVSYAEVIAILMRILGYVNINETDGENWYSGYLKRMYDIKLNFGVPAFKDVNEPAKRGDVAIFWWNMLISDKWAIESETERSGMYYTYSKKTQLQYLFPDYFAVSGKITSIGKGSSGEYLEVTINGIPYDTDSVVPIYALGGTGTGLYDRENKVLIGFAADEDLENYKIVSGPIFYLQEEGYSLKSGKNDASYGTKNSATYAYLFLSEEGKTLRTLYLDASNSYYIDEIKLESQKEDDNGDKKNEEDKKQKPKNVYINKSEDILTTTDAAIIKNGKFVKWEDMKRGIILTELIPHYLYTYEEKTVEGNITNYDSLKELYIDNDKYIVSENCIYTVFGEKTDDEKDKDKKNTNIHNYKKQMSKATMEELLVRNTTFRLNAAEEIMAIEFGKYMPSNVLEKYDNDALKVMYVTGISYGSGEDTTYVRGESINKKGTRLQTKNDNVIIGDLIIARGIEGKEAEKIVKITNDAVYEDDDVMIIYDCQEELYNDSFGEYIINEDTLLFQIDKMYKENSNEKIGECKITRLKDFNILNKLPKCRIILFCNLDMEVEIIFIERDVNKTAQPIGRVISVKRIYDEDGKEDDDDKVIPYVNVEIASLSTGTKKYKLLSGDCLQGELVTYKNKDESEKEIEIKERFKLIFLGYEKDMIVEEYDENTHIAKLSNYENDLNLLDNVYEDGETELMLSDYRYVMTNVERNEKTLEWEFTSSKLREKEELKLRKGDRIAFGELDGVAVVYRGYGE